MTRPYKIVEKPPINRLHELFVYNPETGVLRRRKPRKNAANGSLSTSGYLQSIIDGRLFHVHVIAWAMMTGEWPKDDVDHENGVRSDNRWTNLRAATHSQNCGNKKIHYNNSSGFKGVSRHGSGWRFIVTCKGVTYRSGIFSSPEEAHEGYLKKAEEVFEKYVCRDRVTHEQVAAA